MPILTTSEQIADLCETLSHAPYITIDTEFLREKTYYSKLCLIQVSDPDRNAFAIDPLIEGIDLSPLFQLLRNNDVIKVFHAGRQDMEIFYHLTGEVPAPFFDTQIAAMVCGFGDSIGYEGLVRHITGHALDKSAQFTDWSLRPLSEKQITYALGDVTYLCDIYEHLKANLEEKGRTHWVLQEEEILADPCTYKTDPYATWQRIKIRSPKPRTLAILRELAAWREIQAQKKNIPKNWIIRDDVLADIATQAPVNVQQLIKVRNVSKDLAEGHLGEKILGAIKTALDTPKNTWPQPDRREGIPPTAQAIVDILKMLLKIESSEHGVAAKLVASSSDLEVIAMQDDPDVPAMKGWRYDVFGAGALAVKNGKLAIGLKNGTITKFAIKDL